MHDVTGLRYEWMDAVVLLRAWGHNHRKVTYIFRVLSPGVSPLYRSVDGVCSLLKLALRSSRVRVVTGKTERALRAEKKIVSGFTGPDSGTLSLITMTMDSDSLSFNLNMERL